MITVRSFPRARIAKPAPPSRKRSPATALLNRRLAACGIKINGAAPSDILIYDNRFYKRVLLGGSLALGESYMDGWWDCHALDVLFTRLLSHDVQLRPSARQLMAL